MPVRLRKLLPVGRVVTLCVMLLAAVAVALPARAAVRFETDIAKAKARAQKEGKPILIDVYTDWCGWCHKLDQDVYSKDDVANYINANFVPLKVNPEKDKASEKFVNQYRVEGYPTIIVTTSSGKEADRIVGYREAPEFLKAVKQSHAKAAPKKAPPKRRA